MNSWQQFWRSFRHARHGLYQALAAENSFRIHLAVAVVVVLSLLALRVSAVEAAVVIFLISSILTLELVNTVVERFVDLLEPRIHPYAAMIKDMLAAAVLITTVAAIIIGLLIFWPYVAAVIQELNT